MKASRGSQQLSCTLEVTNVQEVGSDTISEKVIRVSTTSGQNIMSLSISPEIGRHITIALLRAAPTIDLGGKVRVLFDEEFQRDDQTESIPLDQLVVDSVSQEMLEDEPEAASMLAGFRARLLKSLEHIDTAIASLCESAWNKDPVTG